MKVYELMRILSHLDLDDEVRIVVTDPSVVGATPTVGLKLLGITSGFDHNKGKVLMRPSEEIFRKLKHGNDNDTK